MKHLSVYAGLTDTGDDHQLLPQHTEQLRASAICEQVAKARGYRSVTSPAELMDLGFAWSQCRVPGLLIPFHFASAAIEESDPKAARYHFRPDQPRLREGKPAKYETPANSRLHIDVPPSVLDSLQDVTVPLIITEGSKKADAAVSQGLCCIDLPGVWNFDVPDWQHIPVNRREVYICYDSDVMTKPPVLHALRRFRNFLLAKNATVKVLYLRPGAGGAKVGLDDYFAQGGTVEELLTLTTRSVGPLEPRDLDDALPTIETHNRQTREMVDEAMAALIATNNPPSVFVSSGKLTKLRLIEAEAGEFPRLEPLNPNTLSEHLSRAANFVSISSRGGRRSVNPPEIVVRHMLAHGHWPEVPLVHGVVTSPVFAANGVLCATPGYNPDSKLYFHAEHEVSYVDEEPTPENVQRALTTIYDELFVDFPFADSASKAHALAMLLLPFVRSMIHGPTPLHLFDAPRPGTGKTLLANLIARVFAPSGVPVRVAPTDDAEWRKQLTTFFREGGSHLMFDNVKQLQSASLEGALTAPDCMWTDRLLGVNEEGRYPIRCVWALTCNNITGTREQLRRCVWIRLDAKTENPESRTGFRHPNINAWLASNRELVVSAVITLVRAWIAKGMPPYRGPHSLGSFDEWVKVMGGILQTVGEYNFLANQTKLREEADVEGAALHMFVSHWWERFRNRGVQAGQLLETARPFYEDKLGSGSERSQAVRLGKMLTQYKDWVISFGEQKVTLTITPDRKTGQLYRLNEAL